MSKLYIVEGASPSLLDNGMATRRGRKLHLAKELNTFDEDEMELDENIRTLCNLVVYDTEEDEYNEKADCKNCLRLARSL